MIDECVERARFEGYEAINTQVDECFPMQAKQKWNGLWLDEFEGSTFCQSPAKKCEYPEFGSGTRLIFDGDSRPAEIARFGDSTVYQIEFIGRRTRYPDDHSASGAFEHVIIVDRLIALEPQSGR